MRIPGSRAVESRIVRWFEITPADRRIITRGRRDLTSTAMGALSGYAATGGDFITDPKGAAVFVVTSAATAMIGKHGREKRNGGDDAST